MKLRIDGWIGRGRLSVGGIFLLLQTATMLVVLQAKINYSFLLSGPRCGAWGYKVIYAVL